MGYLRKRKVHQYAMEMLAGYDVPKCQECTYKAYGGYEWLYFTSDTGYVTFTVAYSGNFMRVFEKSFDDETLMDKVLCMGGVRCG